jgi:hypothetical protein
MRIGLTGARERVERTSFYRTAHLEVMTPITEHSDKRHPGLALGGTSHEFRGAQISTRPNRVTVGSKIKMRP